MPKKKANAEGTTHSEEKPGKRDREQNTTVTIEFGKHSLILKEIEKLADEEIRPLGLQIIYMLKNQLKAIQQV